ncbi:MAG: ABC transporter substrate-binding protein, partial [Armatimonadetes bacterium]|nr:ABC transporter substrate-binding protein [Armatimonadota bacterium]
RATTAAPAQTLRARIHAEISSFDTIISAASADDAILPNVYSKLVRLRTGTGQLVPDLAEKWTVSPDGKTYTFHLRKGVKWHKGFGEFTADDVKFTFERHMDPANRSRRRTLFGSVEAIRVVSPYTVEIRLKGPQPGFAMTTVADISGIVLSRKAVTQFGRDYGFNPIGTGPYVLERYTRGSELVLVANEEYFSGPPRIKRAVFAPVPEDIVAFTALQAGNIDIMYFRHAEVYRRALTTPRFITLTKPAQSVRAIYMNVTRKPLDDKRVRQAIAHAINREHILRFVLGGTGKIADSVISPQTWGYTSDIPKYPHDPAKAKELLAAAGHPNGFKVNFLFPFQDPYDTWAPAIQEQLARVGITLEMLGMERVAFDARNRRGDYDTMTLGLTRPPDPDVYFTTGWYGPNKPPGSNFSFYSAADRLIEQARVEVDEKKRRALVMQIQRQIAEDVPGVPIYYAFSMVVMQPRVRGHVVGILNDFDLYPMYIEEPRR